MTDRTTYGDGRSPQCHQSSAHSPSWQTGLHIDKSIKSQFKFHVHPMQIQCNSNAISMKIQCKLNVHYMQIQCPFKAHSMQIQCTLNTYSMQIKCKFYANPMYNQCNFNAEWNHSIKLQSALTYTFMVGIVRSKINCRFVFYVKMLCFNINMYVI